jgi:Gas vesicle synthesis protein GvpL/GvpF
VAITSAKYVYGIVPEAIDPPAGPGIGGAPLQLIAGEGAAALVSDLPEAELRVGREELTVHSRVLEEALARGTVLPMRFGVVMAGESAVKRHVLDAHRDELRSQLADLEGKVELNVRAMYEEENLMREVVREDQDVARLRAALRGAPEDSTYYGRIQLGELVAGAVERKRERDASDILAALAPLALAVEVAEPAHERIALSASFLVERERMEEFDAAVDRVGAGQTNRMRFKYTGPLPPHSFVELVAEA